MTLSQALAQARAYNVIVAHDGVYVPYLAQMHAANPQVKILVYQNATYTYRTDLTPTWYTASSPGSRISPKLFPGTYQMTPTNPGWQQWVVRNVQHQLARSGYDGVFLDVLGVASVSRFYVDALPVNATTGKLWTRGEWLIGTRAVATALVTAFPGIPILGNGLLNGGEYFAMDGPTSTLEASGLPMLEAEAWLRGSQSLATAFAGESTWLQDLALVTDVQDRGRGAVVVTKLWAPATAAEKVKWHSYALASFLLVSNGTTSLFSFSTVASDLATPDPLDSINVGTPLGVFQKLDGLYQRTFSDGMALVNPGPDSVTVSLGRTYFRPNRTVAGPWVTLSGQSGLILTSR